MCKRFNFGSAIFAGIFATIIMTIVMGFFGLNIIKVFGLTVGMYGMSIYLVGAIIQLMIGIVYAIIYASIVEPLFQKMPKYVSGTLYSLFPFIIAIFFSTTLMHTLACVFKAPACQNVQMQKAHMNHGGCQGKCQGSEPGSSRALDQPSSSSNLPMWLMSLVDHAVYGLFLGIIYKPKND